ncbi:2-phospho-L-lactate guanylyltransferase [Streptomyces sp. V4-01]|uniref:Phosphoenolpyruvate guanylyltransferase n=1 Tax=Actinacidiphila polyblastidii TaxID=3110430 RepID=A0ABU7PG09_9ACTN|nr:2-phospho-L-lactate guanylyltransferase [Streptomyces sp. V4-01]
MSVPWTVVLPVKPFAVGKSRLALWAGTRRAALAGAFYADTLDAVLAAATVGLVVVVTDEPLAAARAAASGALPLADRPRSGLNAAALHGASYARALAPAAPVAVLAADLPALRPAELDRVLTSAARHPRAFLADHTGRGTTVLTAAAGQPLRPAFEGPSQRNHRLGGAQELAGVHAPSVRLDVDTVDDLRLAEQLGLGPHTDRALSVPGPGVRTPTAPAGFGGADR